MTNLLTITQSVNRFGKQTKVLNPAIITLSGVDLILGILAISFVDLTKLAVFTSVATFTMLITTFMKYKALKNQVDKIGAKFLELTKCSYIYNSSSVLISLFDIVMGIITIVASSFAFAGAISSTVKFIILFGKVIHIKKVQNMARTIGFAGTIYMIIRNKKYLKGVKQMIKKFLKLLNSNKISLMLSTAGITAIVDLILGSPIINETFALLGITEVPLWVSIIIYIGIGIATLAGVKWENIEDFAKRLAEEKTEKVEKAKRKVKEKLHDEAMAEATKQLQEKQKIELELLTNEILEKKTSAIQPNMELILVSQEIAATESKEIIQETAATESKEISQENNSWL